MTQIQNWHHLIVWLDHWKSKRVPENIYFCFFDYAKGFNCVDHNKLWKILKEMGIPDHLTCLLRNLYVRKQELELDLEQQNHCRWWLQPWNYKTLTPWKESDDQPRRHIKKQRHYFANKGPSSQGCGFSSGYVWMWDLLLICLVTKLCPILLWPHGL